VDNGNGGTAAEVKEPIRRDRPFDPGWGLCSTCANAKEIETRKGSVYLLCRAPGLAKYPRTPVTDCPAFVPGAPAGRDRIDGNGRTA
jgi:hypothetical protein